MGWFRTGTRDSSKDSLIPPYLQRKSSIPVQQFDLNARYDVYCSESSHDVLYENMRILGIRTFDAISEFGSGFTSGFLELETVDGVRMMVSQFRIQLICEPGKHPPFRVLNRHRPRDPNE